MADATQSTTPDDFMPKLRNYLAGELQQDPSTVVIGVDETGDVKPHWVGDEMIFLVLKNPLPVNVNAGAGRRGFPLKRQLVVKVRNRGGLDEAGQDEIALTAHWKLQDEVINALLVKEHTQDKTKDFPFLQPIQYLGGGDDVRRLKDTASAYESILVFQINYQPKVKVS
jgi:hypothetical protein